MIFILGAVPASPDQVHQVSYGLRDDAIALEAVDSIADVLAGRPISRIGGVEDPKEPATHVAQLAVGEGRGGRACGCSPVVRATVL